MKCIACNADEFVQEKWQTKGMFSDKMYQIEFCACGLGKTILNDSSELESINLNSYNNLEDRIKIYYGQLHNHLSIRYAQSLTEIEKFTSNKKLLEVGSNIGFTLNIAKKKGFNAFGCEINQKCRDFSKLVFNHTIYNDFFDIKEKFDIIIMNDVLEHFPNPDDAILKAKELLNTRGVIFIQLPNIGSDKAKKMKGKWDYVLAPDHTYHFTIKSLDLLLNKHNFLKLWSRTASGIYDMKFNNLIPSKIGKQVNHFMNTNTFYYPKLYTRKNGELLQGIYRNND